jgi:hypothetical protein
MDLTPFEPWLKLTHVLGAFMFATGHGVSMFVMFRVKQETDPERLKALLDVSIGSFGFSFAGLGVLVLAGAIAGISGGYWGQGWLSVAVLVLVVVTGAMTPMAAIPLGNLRRALGMRTRETKAGDPLPEAKPMTEVLAMTAALRPDRALAVGGAGFAIILALMTLKPF